MLAHRHILHVVTGVLLALAVVMIRSAGMTVGSHGAGMSGLVLNRDCLYAVLGIVSLLVGSRISIREMVRVRGLYNPIPWLILVSFGLAVLALVPGMGRSVNGASRWVYMGPRQWGLSFQPSELIKWVLVLVLAGWCAMRSGVMHRFRYGAAPMLVLLGAGCGLIVVEDLGTAGLMALVGAVVLIAGGVRWWQLGLAVPVGVGAVIAAMIHSPYRIRRLITFLDPWADPLGAGYHPIQSMLTVAQGGVFGRGLGNGIQKFGYLPEDTTDFIFAIVCEELGLMGAVLVIVLYLGLLWGLWSILRRCDDLLGRLFTLGVMAMIGLQAVINLAVVTVVAPTKGIALPLLSRGGTGWILTAFCIGLVCGLDRENQMADETVDPTQTEGLPPVRR